MLVTLRNCIIAEEGHTLLALDASQIELRCLGFLSGDQQLIEDLRTGDLHMATAIRMYGHLPNWDTDEELRKKKRYDAKQGNFAMVYGADEDKLSEMLDCTVEEALQFMADHKEAYPRLYEWMAERIQAARENGYTVNMFGRIRPIPDINSPIDKLRKKAEREVVNTEVQGTAVDIVKMAMLVLRGLYPPEIRLVLQVHDEMVFECPDSLLEETIETSKELIKYFPDYPFTTAVGKRYGSMKEVNVNA